MSIIKFFALGGLGEHGKNMYVLEVGEKIFILDAGMKFPSVELYGIDGVLPDFSYVIENQKKVKAIFLSHGHDDNIGAVFELLKHVNVGVYGTHFTISLLEKQLQEEGMKVSNHRLYRINDDKILKFGNIVVSFYSTSHSIPESLGIVIKTADGLLVYAPGFAFSSNSDKKYKTNFGKIGDLGKEKVLALFAESLGAVNASRTDNDSTLIHTVTDAVRKEGRIIFSMYSTDLDRIQKVINISLKNNRRVAIVGRKVQNIINVAMETGYLEIPEDKFVNLRFIDEKNKNDDKDLVIIITGNHHEPFNMLQRMASGQDRLININENDHVVIVSNPQLGTERISANAMDMLSMVDAKVTIIKKMDLRSSHAGPEDLKMLYGMINPKYIIPIVGEYRHQYLQKKIALEAGYENFNVVVLENGEVISFENGILSTKRDRIKSGDVLVDGSVIGDINEVVLRDREFLSQAGTVIISIILDSRNKRLVSGPEVVFKGFVSESDAKELIENVISKTNNILNSHLKKRYIDWNLLRTEIKDVVGKYLYFKTKSNPIITPVVIDEELK